MSKTREAGARARCTPVRLRSPGGRRTCPRGPALALPPWQRKSLLLGPPGSVQPLLAAAMGGAKQAGGRAGSAPLSGWLRSRGQWRANAGRLARQATPAPAAIRVGTAVNRSSAVLKRATGRPRRTSWAALLPSRNSTPPDVSTSSEGALPSAGSGLVYPELGMASQAAGAGWPTALRLLGKCVCRTAAGKARGSLGVANCGAPAEAAISGASVLAWQPLGPAAIPFPVTEALPRP